MGLKCTFQSLPIFFFKIPIFSEDTDPNIAEIGKAMK